MAQRLARLAAPVLQLKCVTVDVTGTLLAFKGHLGDYYCLAAKSAGQPCPDYKRVHDGFKVAYKTMARKYPCFGSTTNKANIEWWRMCVVDSFVQAGYFYDKNTLDNIFERIYSVFGSVAPYSLLPDAIPFLRGLREQGVIVGIVSNADYRYRDVILPALGLREGSEWDFGVFSGIDQVEKPDPRIYKLALQRAGNVSPSASIHIGDSYAKDFLPARNTGMNAVLLDRFKSVEAQVWKSKGALVFPDLKQVERWIQSWNGIMELAA